MVAVGGRLFFGISQDNCGNRLLLALTEGAGLRSQSRGNLGLDYVAMVERRVLEP